MGRAVSICAVEGTLRTARLRLRRFTEADVDNLWALDGDPDVTRYLDGAARSRDEVRTELLPSYLSQTRLGHLAAETQDGTFVGWISLRPVVPQDGPMVDWPDAAEDTGVAELGYRIRSALWGHGYATEGASRYVQLAFTELGVREIVATTMAVNTGSRRVLRKVGLRYLRTRYLDWPDPLPGNEFGDVEYALTHAELAEQTG